MGTIDPEDYKEPRCVLCDDPYGKTPEIKPVPLPRIIEKVDEYQSRKDFAGAVRLLEYWLNEAVLGYDRKGQLGIRNEFIGLYRKNGRKTEAYENIDEALVLLKELEFEDSISAGTTYTNAATACYAFSDYDRALPLFEKALTVYENSSGTSASLLGGLYNNMGLTLTALKQFDRAEESYKKAFSIMTDVLGGGLEQAITYLNMADMLEARDGMIEAESEIFSLLDQAEKLLNDGWKTAAFGSIQEKGYYAFVCESCAPTFSYYGYFQTADELEKIAREIYDAANS